MYCGAVTSGLGRMAKRSLHEQLREREIDSPSVLSRRAEVIGSHGVRWVKPQLVGVIEYREFTVRFRHPSWKGLITADPKRIALRRWLSVISRRRRGLGCGERHGRGGADVGGDSARRRMGARPRRGYAVICEHADLDTLVFVDAPLVSEELLVIQTSWSGTTIDGEPGIVSGILTVSSAARR